jgi:hypothetical protein
MSGLEQDLEVLRMWHATMNTCACGMPAFIHVHVACHCEFMRMDSCAVGSSQCSPCMRRRGSKRAVRSFPARCACGGVQETASSGSASLAACAGVQAGGRRSVSWTAGVDG